MFADLEARDVMSEMTEYDLAKSETAKIYMSFGNNGNEDSPNEWDL